MLLMTQLRSVEIVIQIIIIFTFDNPDKTTTCGVPKIPVFTQNRWRNDKATVKAKSIDLSVEPARFSPAVQAKGTAVAAKLRSLRLNEAENSKWYKEGDCEL
jgi:hypothetical protein